VTMSADTRTRRWDHLDVVAGNGLLDRRVFLAGGAVITAGLAGYTLSEPVAAQQLVDAPWSTRAGDAIPDYGVPSRFEKHVARTLTSEEVYALTADILALNRIIDDNDVMNAETLPGVRMPNRDGFVVRFPDKTP
jgi:hypothetical protein